MLMKTRYSNKPLLAILITAFLFLQWSATHIHLAGEHDHDGQQHQHSATAHQHQLNDYHADAIDSAIDLLSHADTNKVVELDHVCTQQHVKFDKHYALLPSETWNPVTQGYLCQHGVMTHQADIYQAYYQYSPIRLRAPPVFS